MKKIAILTHILQNIRLDISALRQVALSKKREKVLLLLVLLTIGLGLTAPFENVNKQLFVLNLLVNITMLVTTAVLFFTISKTFSYTRKLMIHENPALLLTNLEFIRKQFSINKLYLGFTGSKTHIPSKTIFLDINWLSVPFTEFNLKAIGFILEHEKAHHDYNDIPTTTLFDYLTSLKETNFMGCSSNETLAYCAMEAFCDLTACQSSKITDPKYYLKVMEQVFKLENNMTIREVLENNAIELRLQLTKKTLEQNLKNITVI